MRCKTCKTIFIPKNFNQKNCFENIECIKAEIDVKKKAKVKSWSKEKKIRKDRLKTKGDYLKEVQTVFNKFIRLRDFKQLCISCSKEAKKKNAGHYRSVGSCPELRFEELNVHLQCEYCNTYLHANLINYRINLILKIGVNNIKWLEGNHKPKRYTVEQLMELKEYYKKKIKGLEAL